MSMPTSDRAARAAVAASLTRGCSVEQTLTPRGLMLTLCNSDGGHRPLAARDGRGLVAADGADLIEVAVGDDCYRLPATVRR